MPNNNLFPYIYTTSSPYYKKNCAFFYIRKKKNIFQGALIVIIVYSLFYVKFMSTEKLHNKYIKHLMFWV